MLVNSYERCLLQTDILIRFVYFYIGCYHPNSGLQRLLDVCFDFNIRTDIMFNPIKYVCVVFKSKSNKLYCPTVSLDCDILEYTAYTKYLGFTFSMNVQDVDDMLRQMRTLYIRSKKLLRTFYHCSIDVNLELFTSFCTSFYCCYLRTAYKKIYI